MNPNVALELSSVLAGFAETVGTSVVRVVGRRHSPGSGVVWSTDGTIVTASHVLEWDEDIDVVLADGKTVAATLVGRDPTTDVATLKAGASGLTTAPWSDPAVRVGHLVLALSRPGRSVRAALGTVSAFAGSWRTPAGGRLDHYLETDLGRHPGFSGGALVDMSGSVVGLNTSGLLRSAALALTTPTLRRVIESLTTHGRVRRGFLGVGTYAVRLPATLAASLGQPSGLLVLSVEPETPAARAGLLQGDVLVSLDGRQVAHAGDLLLLLDETRIGTEVVSRVVRAGEVREAKVTIGERTGGAT